MTISPVRGLVWCYGEDEVLAAALPQNVRQLASLLVVTHPADHKTQLLCRDYYSRGVRCFVTDVPLNRGCPLETGIKMLGREGWMLVLQPQLSMPETEPLCTGAFRHGHLHLAAELQPTDFFLFHADDVRLQRRRPWFNHKLANPLGAFIARWPQRLRVILPSRVTNLRKVS